MEKVYLTFENMISIQLKKSGTALTATEMASITSMAIVYNGVSYSSGSYPTAFDWTTLASTGVVVLKLGLIPFASTGIDRSAELIVYTSDYPGGIVWVTLGLNVLDIIS